MSRIKRLTNRAVLLSIAVLGMCFGLARTAHADLTTIQRDLQRATHDSDLARVRDLLLQLGGIREPEAVQLILRTLGVVAPEEVIEAAITALLSHGPELTGAPFEEQLARSRPDPVICATIFAVAERLDDERSEQWLLTGLTSKDELVIRNAIESLRHRRSKNAIPALIRILETTSGRRTIITYAARQALIDLTGQGFEVVEDWWSFWEVNKDTLDPRAPRETDGATGVVPRKPDDAKTPSFFGVEIVSRRLVFVIDCSGSMDMYDEAQEEGGSGADWRIRQRMPRARNQLISAIEKLPAGAFFNIVAYNENLRVFNDKGIVPATAQSKRKAVDFVKSLRAQSTTHTDKALRTAFDDKNIDSIILLSDGAPTHGQRGASGGELVQSILDEVRKLNRLRRLKIFTFGFEGLGRYPPGHRQENVPPTPSEGMVEFLKRLAEENGGGYTRIL